MKKSEKYDFEESLAFTDVKIKKTGDVSWELSKPDAIWCFQATDAKQMQEWYEEFQQNIEAWQLQELCNVELLNSSSARLQILSATYGDLSDPKSCIEVTQQLRDMCTGDRLDIQGGIEKSKLPGFVDPVAQGGWSGLHSLVRKKKKHLTIAWTDIDGAHTNTWDDTEPVTISYNK